MPDSLPENTASGDCPRCGGSGEIHRHETGRTATYLCECQRVPSACTCGDENSVGVSSLDPLRHGFDCPVRTVFQGL